MRFFRSLSRLTRFTRHSAQVDCKVVLLGRHSVGKTSLVDRYLNGEYNAKVRLSASRSKRTRSHHCLASPPLQSTATIGAAFRCARFDFFSFLFSLFLCFRLTLRRCHNSARQVTVGAETVTLGIWDTAGAERYESMRSLQHTQQHTLVVLTVVAQSHLLSRCESCTDLL